VRYRQSSVDCLWSYLCNFNLCAVFKILWQDLALRIVWYFTKSPPIWHKPDQTNWSGTDMYLIWNFLIGEYGGFWSEFDQYTDQTRIKFFDRINIKSNQQNIKCRHWKDIYQRIFISHILSKNREKGYSPIHFLSGICWRI
jgi:hypothetical protein